VRDFTPVELPVSIQTYPQVGSWSGKVIRFLTNRSRAASDLERLVMKAEACLDKSISVK
jgi:hypothetical protein